MVIVIIMSAKEEIRSSSIMNEKSTLGGGRWLDQLVSMLTNFSRYLWNTIHEISKLRFFHFLLIILVHFIIVFK